MAKKVKSETQKHAGTEMRNSNLIKPETKTRDYNREMAGNRYRHFKGDIYQVDHIGIDTENLSLIAIYHERHHPFIIWCRPLEEFLSPVDHEKYPDIKQQYRFEKL